MSGAGQQHAFYHWPAILAGILLLACIPLLTTCGSRSAGILPASSDTANSRSGPALGGIPDAGLDPVARAAVPADESGGEDTAATIDLESLLMDELARLGKDPSSTASLADATLAQSCLLGNQYRLCRHPLDWAGHVD